MSDSFEVGGAWVFVPDGGEPTTWRINYSVTVGGDEYSGTVEATDRTMTARMGRQYALRDLPDDVVHRAGFDVAAIDVEYEPAD